MLFHYRANYSGAPVKEEKQPRLVEYFVLSLLLHILIVILFGNPDGSGSSRGQKMLGSLNVSLQHLFAKTGDATNFQTDSQINSTSLETKSLKTSQATAPVAQQTPMTEAPPPITEEVMSATPTAATETAAAPSPEAKVAVPAEVETTHETALSTPGRASISETVPTVNKEVTPTVTKFTMPLPTPFPAPLSTITPTATPNVNSKAEEKPTVLAPHAEIMLSPRMETFKVPPVVLPKTDQTPVKQSPPPEPIAPPSKEMAPLSPPSVTTNIEPKHSEVPVIEQTVTENLVPPKITRSAMPTLAAPTLQAPSLKAVTKIEPVAVPAPAEIQPVPVVASFPEPLPVPKIEQAMMQAPSEIKPREVVPPIPQVVTQALTQTPIQPTPQPAVQSVLQPLAQPSVAAPATTALPPKSQPAAAETLAPRIERAPAPAVEARTREIPAVSAAAVEHITPPQVASPVARNPGQELRAPSEVIKAPGNSGTASSGTASSASTSRAGLPSAGLETAATTGSSTPAPGLDLESLRNQARALGREGSGTASGSGQRGLFQIQPPLTIEEHKSKLAQALEKAATPDCREAYSGMGIAAVIPLVANTIRRKGCNW